MSYEHKYLKYKSKYLELVTLLTEKSEQDGGASKNRIIIHILGPSGAGKTTLGNKLATLPNTVSIDTDDIDDANSLKLLRKYDLENENDRQKFRKYKEKLNRIELDKFLQKNKNKNIVFVGFDFIGMEQIPKLAQKNKFAIKVDHDTLFRQYNLRTLEYITKNKDAIKKLLLDKKMSIDNIFYILLFKYKIRHGFDCEAPPDVEKHIKESNNKNTRKGYKVMNSNDIYSKIVDIIVNNQKN